MREYETIYLLKADLPQDQLSNLKEKYTNVITEAKGHLLSQGDWGKRKLAYDVKKSPHGHYIYLHYLGGENLVGQLERLLRLEDSVLKFLTVKLAEEIDVELRTKEGKKGEAPPAPEEISRSGPAEGSHGRRSSGRTSRPRESSAPAKPEAPKEKKAEKPADKPSPEESKED